MRENRRGGFAYIWYCTLDREGFIHPDSRERELRSSQTRPANWEKGPWKSITTDKLWTDEGMQEDGSGSLCDLVGWWNGCQAYVFASGIEGRMGG